MEVATPVLVLGIFSSLAGLVASINFLAVYFEAYVRNGDIVRDCKHIIEELRERDNLGVVRKHLPIWEQQRLGRKILEHAERLKELSTLWKTIFCPRTRKAQLMDLKDKLQSMHDKLLSNPNLAIRVNGSISDDERPTLRQRSANKRKHNRPDSTVTLNILKKHYEEAVTALEQAGLPVPTISGKIHEEPVQLIPFLKRESFSGIKYSSEGFSQNQGYLSDFNMSVQHEETFKNSSYVWSVRYSDDGKYVAVSSLSFARIYDVASRNCITELAGSDDSNIRDLCFSSDNRKLITGSENHTVKVWDIGCRSVEHTCLHHKSGVNSVDVSRNSRFIVSGSDDGTVKLTNLETGNLVIKLDENNGLSSSVTSVCASPSSHLVAAACKDKVVYVWDVETNRLVHKLKGHLNKVNAVAFSPDGQRLLSGSCDKTAKLWDVTSSQCLSTFTGHKHYVKAVTFCSSDRFAISGSHDTTVRFWDLRYSIEALLLQGHTLAVRSVAHNPVSQSLTTGSFDKCAKIWTYR